MPVQITKPRGKRYVLRGGNGLVTEEQHLMLQQCLLYPVVLLISQRQGHIQPLDLSADGRAKGMKRQAHDYSPMNLSLTKAE
jgi:hypothetical protein